MTQKLSPQAKANKIAYTNAWVKANYVNVSMKMRPEEKAKLVVLAEKHGKTIKALLMDAVYEVYGKE